VSVLGQVIGHRGAGVLAPENTLSAFRFGAALGLRSVEFDVRVTADGAFVLMHDEDVARTTQGRGRVADLSLEQVRALDASARFARLGCDEPVPTLQEAAACLAQLNMSANIEIKTEAPAAFETGVAVARWLATDWPALLAPPLVSSFDEAALAGVAAGAQDLARALVVADVPADWAACLKRLGCTSMHCAVSGLNERNIDEVAKAGISLRVYTVDDVTIARRLLSRGVAGVFTDRPDRLLENGALRLHT
jgi:glycerophosphoryl diester phosphodiesterase